MIRLGHGNHQRLYHGIILIFMIQICSLPIIMNGNGSILAHSKLYEKSESNQEDSILNARMLDRSLPFDVKGAGIGSNGSHFFLFGGTTDLLSGRRNIITIDYQTFKHVENVSVSLPSPVRDMGYVQINNRVYLIGGSHYNTFSRKILSFNLATLQFETVNSELPVGLESPKTEFINGDIYILCGMTSTGINDKIYKFMPGKDSLITLSTSIPDRLTDPIVHWTGSEILLIGGNYSDTLECSDEIWSFDPSEENLHKKETNLPFPLKSLSYISVDSRVYTFDNLNSSTPISTALEINTETLEVKVLEEELFVPCRHSFTLGRDDFYLYLFGGIINQNGRSENSIIRIDLNFNHAKTVFQEPANPAGWELTDESSFTGNNSLEWYTNSSQCVAMVDFERNTTSRDYLELEVIYDNHSDINTRQAVNIGWTDATSFSRSDGVNLTNIPAQNFVGISIRNSLSFILLSTQFVKNNRLVYQNDYYLIPNVTHCIRLQIWLTNQTCFFQTITVDGEVTALDYIQGNLTGISFNNFAIWNQNVSNQEIQGQYNGELTFVRYTEDIINPHISTWFTVDIQEEDTTPPNSGALNGLLLISFILIILGTAIGGPLLLKLLIKKKMDEEINGEMIEQISLAQDEEMEGIELTSKPLVSARLHALYKRLHGAFNRLKIILDELNNQEQTPTVREKRLLSPWAQEGLVPLERSDFTSLSSISMNILIYLLEHVVQGTFFSVIKAELKLNKSTLSYNLNILEDRKLISKKSPSINPDMRFKVITVTPKGTQLLYQIYCKLNKFFE